MKLYWICLFVFQWCVSAMAQGLTEKQIEDIARKRLIEFSGYLTVIASKNHDLSLRQDNINYSVRLFKKNAIVEASNKKKTSTISYSVRNYLQRLLTLPYKVVILKWESIKITGTPKKYTDPHDGTTKWLVSATVIQFFCGKCEADNASDPCCYIDRTIKNIEIILEQNSAHGSYLDVHLGDIRVKETR